MARAAPARMKVAVEVDRADLRAADRAYAALVPEVKRLTEQAADRHARALVPAIAARAASRGPQARLASSSVRYTGNATIVAGGSRALPVSRPRRRPAGGDVFFGSEFGANRYRQFPRPHKRGWWYLRTITAAKRVLRDAYQAALERAARSWGQGG